MFPRRHSRARRDPSPPGVARLHPLSPRRRGRGAVPGFLLAPAAAPDLRRAFRPSVGALPSARGNGAGGGDSAPVGPRDRRRDQAPASVRTDRRPAARGQRNPERPREAAPDAPPPAGGRGERQDDRRLDRRDGRLAARRAGRGDGAHGDPGGAALPEVPGTVGGTAGPGRAPFRRAPAEGAGSGAETDPGRGGGHRRGNACADPGERRLPQPGARSDRRAAPVRGSPACLPPQERKDLSPPPRHDRHADPADARDHAVRRPRRLGARRDASRKDPGAHEGRNGGRSPQGLRGDPRGDRAGREGVRRPPAGGGVREGRAAGRHAHRRASPGSVSRGRAWGCCTAG